MKQCIFILCALFGVYSAQAQSYAVEWSFGDKTCDSNKYTDLVHQVFRQVGLIPSDTYVMPATEETGARKLGEEGNLRNGQRELQYAMCEWCETRFWGPLVCYVYWGVCNKKRRELTEGGWIDETFESMHSKCLAATDKITSMSASDCDMKTYYCNVME